MSARSEKAVEFHHMGCNCAQSVACAFAADVDMDEKLVFRFTEGLGRGVGGFGGTCGALLGACVVASLVTSDGVLHSPPTKATTHTLAEEMFNSFNDCCGSTVCSELRGEDTGKVLTSCDDCIAHATEITEQILKFA